MTTATLTCNFCAHHCHIAPNHFGRCGIRKNTGTEITTANYADVVALGVDPIEKKPLYHFMPRADALSVALAGCNFTCKFCQNYNISQKDYFAQLQTDKWPPQQLAQKAVKLNTPVMAYTYAEPTVWRDYMIDTAKLVKKQHRKNVMVTNGFFSEETLDIALEHIDAFNIDLKGSDDFYRKICGARVAPVLESIRKIAIRKKTFLEVTTLLIERLHTVDDIMGLADFLEKSAVKVWHLSRFFPCFKMFDHPATSEDFLLSIIEKVKANFDIPHVYAGNSGLEQYNQTICPDCGAKLIGRQGWAVTQVNLRDGKCKSCGHELYGYFPD